jgi:hypothetical protein
MGAFGALPAFYGVIFCVDFAVIRVRKLSDWQLFTSLGEFPALGVL